MRDYWLCDLFLMDGSSILHFSPYYSIDILSSKKVREKHNAPLRQHQFRNCCERFCNLLEELPYITLLSFRAGNSKYVVKSQLWLRISSYYWALVHVSDCRVCMSFSARIEHSRRAFWSKICLWIRTLGNVCRIIRPSHLSRENDSNVKFLPSIRRS